MLIIYAVLSMFMQNVIHFTEKAVFLFYVMCFYLGVVILWSTHFFVAFSCYF